MMLYVFHVDVGRMMSFDMTVALSSVENLKDTIERLHGIPAANIVLLVSGGEMLTETTQVSYYSAGTDTNPIYMFLTGDFKVPLSTMPQTDTDLDLRGQVERSMELPAVYETVVTRTQLAVKMYEQAREEERLCERLVQDQHLQQQGWAAVVANMEDLTEEFRLRFRNFCSFFDRHLSQRTRHLELLQNFSADLTKLSRIPILPGLMPLAEADFHGFDEYLDNDDVFSRSHSQQESVLATQHGGTKAPQVASPVEAVSSETLIKSDACDTSSTSPNKKAKLGETDVAAEQLAKPEQSSSGSGKNVRRITLNLLQWITSKENHNALQTMSIECVQGLSTFNEEIYEKLKSEVQNTINIAEQGDVKEIRGLGERLCKLDEFKYKIKNMVQEQKEHSTGFQQNQSRAINLRDPSILPDLCDSHRSQLQVMLQNHHKILEHRRCIAKAKDELGTNLHMRLNRIVCIENAMSDIDNRLLFYHRYLRRAERHIGIIEQIHQAPSIYVGAVTEVVRRKIFSEEFGKWASKLSDDFDAIHSEEIKRREMFNASFDGHFLNILFPGMNDMPPSFANENPLTFDARLPNLTKSDIDLLTSYLPDLANQIRLPDMWPVIKFFVSRSGDHQKERWEQLLKQQALNELATMKTGTEKPQHARLTELQKSAAGETSAGGGGYDESETDTEIEFEKVPAACASGTTSLTSHVPGETEETEKITEVSTLTRSTITECLLMTSAETLTDENGSATRDEVDRLRHLLNALSQHSLECIRMARGNLKTFRTDAEEYRNDLQADIQALQDTCKLVHMRCEEREQQLLQENHSKETELEQLREQLKNRDAEIERLQAEVCNLSSLREKCDLLAEEMKEMQTQFNREKETAVAMAREELIHEHKTEIESLRCRFKLMTSMERSPSDMSLEKIERPTSRAAAAEDVNHPAYEMIELKQHEAIRAQLQAEKERAVNAAVEAERIMWQSKITLNSESVMANVGILKVIEEKEKQLEQLRERELMLTKENFQLKTRLDALTNEDANSWLKEKIEYLHRDKERLEKELEKTRRLEMEGSYAGPPRSLTYEHNVLPRSKSSSSSHKYVVLQSIEKGDVVFTVWSTTYGQYIVIQDSQNLFFVHGESLAGLQLQLPKREIESPVVPGDELTTMPPATAAIPIPYYAVGIVVEKEYCQARKDENRYRVPRGSKFYRVKVAPLAIAQPTVRVPRDRLESCSRSVSRSQSQCESQSEVSTGAVMAAVSSSVVQLPPPVPSSESTTTTTTTITRRNRSTGSKTEEEEPLQLLSERCRYVSVSEEEESSVTNAAIQQQQSQPQQQQQQQQSVITEQPTASNNLKLDLMFLTTTPTITDTTPTTTSSSQEDPMVVKETEEGPKEHKEVQADQVDAAKTGSSTPDAALATAAAAVVTASSEIPISSFNTTSEDSDEYRSLEGKEEDTAFASFD